MESNPYPISSIREATSTMELLYKLHKEPKKVYPISIKLVDQMAINEGWFNKKSDYRGFFEIHAVLTLLLNKKKSWQKY